MYLKIGCMKKYLLVFLLMIPALVMKAQIERKSPAGADSLKAAHKQAGKNKHARKEMLDQLSLTREQRGKLKQLRSEGQAKRTEIQNNEQLTGEQKKAQLGELKKQQAEKLQSILTQEQKEKFRASRAKKSKVKTVD